jgi:hypothetical protein
VGLADVASKNAGEAVAFGLGFALARALTPVAVGLEQEAFKEAPTKVPDGVLLAAGLAQGQVDEATASEWAKMTGYGPDAFKALVDIANTGPALGAAYQALRRGFLTDAEFETALKRTGLEEQWNAAMLKLADELLDPGAIATAVHRGIMAGGGLIIREPPIGQGKIPHVAQSTLSAVDEFAGHGIDAERARILVGNTGLPLALGQMLQLLNRGDATEDDVRRSIAQSNVRNEYMDAALNLRRRLLTPHEYVEAKLRGWIDDGAMQDGAGLSGMEPDDAELLAKLSGRPLSFHQVFIGERRGGRYDGPTNQIDAAFLKSLQESNVRPEWYALAWAQRFSYPGVFVLRAMAAAGDLTVAETEQVLLYIGWEPTFAKKVSARWAASASGGGKDETKAELLDEFAGGYMAEPELRKALGNLGYTGHAQDLLVHLADARRVKRWREKIIDAIGASHLAFKIDDATATSELAELGVTGQASTLLVTLWNRQRRDTIALLTVAQIVKAWKKGMLTKDEALADLEDREYSADDAARLLV